MFLSTAFGTTSIGADLWQDIRVGLFSMVARVPARRYQNDAALALFTLPGFNTLDFICLKTCNLCQTRSGDGWDGWDGLPLGSVCTEKGGYYVFVYVFYPQITIPTVPFNYNPLI